MRTDDEGTREGLHASRSARPHLQGASAVLVDRVPVPFGSAYIKLTFVSGPHLQIADRWAIQYNFYINDKAWGRMFVRVCPYLPFSARVCLN